MLREIITADGKYTTTNENGHLKVYRYKEEDSKIWREDSLIGDGYVLSLVQRIEELEDEIRVYEDRAAGSAL